MAIWYVDSAAVGTNAGTSWTDAWTSIASTTAVAAGDTIRIAYTHDQTLAGAVTFLNTASANGALAYMVSTDPVNDRPRFGAKITSGSNHHLNCFGYFWGIHFVRGNNQARLPYIGWFEECRFQCAGASSYWTAQNIFSTLRFYKCTWDNATAALQIFFSNTAGTAAIYQMFNNDLSGLAIATNQPAINANTGNPVVAVIRDTDLSGYPYLISQPTWATGVVVEINTRFERCRLHPSWTVSPSGSTDRSTNGNAQVELIGCYSGTQTVAAWQYLYVSYEGSAEATDAVYRDGSVAADGAKKLSIALKAHANRTTKNSLQAARTRAGIAMVWLTGGVAVTVGIEVAHNAVGSGTAGRLTNHECWATVSHPSATDPAPANATSALLARDPTAVAADLTDSALAWTGTGTGTKQRIVTGTITPAVDGYFSVEAFFAPESASDVTIHVCTNPVVTVI